MEDFEADTSDEALLIDEGPVQFFNSDAEDEEDKTDAMTVNTDMMDDIQQYDIIADSSQDNSAVNQDGFDGFAADDEDVYNNDVKSEDDDDEFEVVSHVKRSKDTKDTKNRNHGHVAEHGSTGLKGKGKAPVKVDPDEPLENLLASFGKLTASSCSK